MALTQPIDTAEGIAFEDLFNLSDIQYLQDGMPMRSLRPRLCPDGTPITQPSNFSELCGEIIRKTSQERKNCHHSDAMIGQHNPTGSDHPTMFERRSVQRRSKYFRRRTSYCQLADWPGAERNPERGRNHALCSRNWCR